MENLNIKSKDMISLYGNYVIKGDFMQGNQRQALDLSYIAGLMDGEGSYCILKANTEETMRQTNRKSPMYYAVIRIGMVHREPLEFIQKTLGVGILRDEGVRKDRPTYQPMYRWTVHKKAHIYQVCKLLLPYSKVKVKQMHNIIDLFEKWENPFVRQKGISPEELLRRERHWQIGRELNAVGAAATTKSQGRREAEVIV